MHVKGTKARHISCPACLAVAFEPCWGAAMCPERSREAARLTREANDMERKRRESEDT